MSGNTSGQYCPLYLTNIVPTSIQQACKITGYNKQFLSKYNNFIVNNKNSNLFALSNLHEQSMVYTITCVNKWHPFFGAHHIPQHMYTVRVNGLHVDTQN